MVGGDTWNYGAVPNHILKRVRELSDICKSFDVPLPAAALQFPLGHEQVCSVIPGLRNLKELADTINWVTQTIPTEFWHELKNRNLLHPDAPVPSTVPFVEVTS
ncbi:aldo/keto reductase [Aliiroseovarius sp. 2305UL8-7]|uniref:aldo/keto reductase n=1 Tax=Aliiroseovarius conchicola TaxID=3121637 RepID=UPI003527F982